MKQRKYRRIIEALRDDDAFWAFMSTHPLREDGNEFTLQANRVVAEYLESRFGKVEPEPVPERMLDLAAGRVVTATFGTSTVVELR